MWHREVVLTLGGLGNTHPWLDAVTPVQTGSSRVTPGSVLAHVATYITDFVDTDGFPLVDGPATPPLGAPVLVRRRRWAARFEDQPPSHRRVISSTSFTAASTVALVGVTLVPQLQSSADVQRLRYVTHGVPHWRAPERSRPFRT